MRRRGILAALLATTALLLSGCMRVQMDFALQPDDTVDGSIVMAFSDDLAELMGSDPEAVGQEMGSDLESDLPPGGTQEPYAEDGYTGTRVTFQDVAIAEMSDDEGSLTITREGDEFVVGGSMDLTDSSGEDLGGLSGSLADAFDMRIAITFPGAVTEHNGTLEGRTVVWEPRSGELNELRARGGAGSGALGGILDSGGVLGGGGGAPSWLPIVLIALGVGALAIVVFVLVLVRSRKSQPAGAAESASMGGLPVTPQPYPTAQDYPQRQPSGPGADQAGVAPYPQGPPPPVRAPQQPAAETESKRPSGPPPVAGRDDPPPPVPTAGS